MPYWRIPKIETGKPTIVPKGWGKEIIFTKLHKPSWETLTYPPLEEEPDYCGKILCFERVGAEGSMHFHVKKHETFYIHSGKFKLKYIDTMIADEHEIELVAGDVVVIPPHNPHKVVCLEVGEIFESSTTDYSDDSYRVQKGDSQKS
jgi:mannose-6-phosphate isomerase-like protein (cupin superfamily)